MINVKQVNTEYVVSSSDSGGLADELKSLVQAFRFVCVPVPLCIHTERHTHKHSNTHTHTHTHTHMHTCPCTEIERERAREDPRQFLETKDLDAVGVSS